jgi:hypothetical protein
MENNAPIFIGKLISGEFIIGRSLNGIMLINIFKINVSVDTITGGHNLKLMPFMWPLDSSVNHSIAVEKCLSLATPSRELVETYITSLVEQAKRETAEKLEEVNKGLENPENTPSTTEPVDTEND